MNTLTKDDLIYWYIALFVNKYTIYTIRIFLLLSFLSIFITSLPFHWTYILYYIGYLFFQAIVVTYMLTKTESKRVIDLVGARFYNKVRKYTDVK